MKVSFYIFTIPADEARVLVYNHNKWIEERKTEFQDFGFPESWFNTNQKLEFFKGCNEKGDIIAYSGERHPFLQDGAYDKLLALFNKYKLNIDVCICDYETSDPRMLYNETRRDLITRLSIEELKDDIIEHQTNALLNQLRLKNLVPEWVLSTYSMHYIEYDSNVCLSAVTPDSIHSLSSEYMQKLETLFQEFQEKISKECQKQ